MTLTHAAFLIFVCSVAASYGWGMRGAVIGGEKGALLPGALIGMSIALFSGIDALRDNWQLYAAAGALAMGYGGFEPYAQTADFMLHDSAPYASMKKCFAGLFIKGANWFGIAAGIFSLSLGALSGKYYKTADIIILFALIPFIQLLGIKIFNKPFDRKNGVFPKIYFSRGSREEWGGNLLTMLAVFALAAIRKDFVTLIFVLTGIVFGGVGWFFSMWLCHKASKMKKRYVDSWKIMEFAYGAVGGLAFSVCFALNYGRISAAYSGVYTVTANGIKGADFLAWAAFAIVIIMAIQYPLEKKTNEKTQRALELTERAVYYSLLLCLCVLGNMKAARLTVFPVILWVLYEENAFDGRITVLFRRPAAGKAVLTVLFALSVIGEIFIPGGYTPVMTIVMYTAAYIVSDLLYFVLKFRKPGAYCTVHAYFLTLSTVLIIIFV
ncbi:MAG: hypothetical protein MJ177_01580 [Clostridia bacterium]|nr:hypothetical protein [Clostridia bacterium]